MRRKGSTNKELFTWKRDLLSPWFLAGMEEWGRMQTFSEQPSGQTPEINGKSYASAISWLKTRIYFEILRSVHKCVKGSRTPFQENDDFLEDFSVNTRNAEILKLVLACFLE